MGTVRAKFVCTDKQDNGATAADGLAFNVTLSPVTGGSEENKEFYKWTPGGSISLSTINQGAADQFEVGKEYYVDFSPAN